MVRIGGSSPCGSNEYIRRFRPTRPQNCDPPIKIYSVKKDRSPLADVEETDTEQKNSAQLMPTGEACFNCVNRVPTSEACIRSVSCFGDYLDSYRGINIDGDHL